MAYSANGNYINDSIIRNRAAWLVLHPVIYSTDIPGIDTSETITGNEIFVYNE